MLSLDGKYRKIFFSLTPSNDAQPVDHGCVAIGADHTVWVKQTLIVEHYTSQILQVHLKVKGERGWREGKGRCEEKLHVCLC